MVDYILLGHRKDFVQLSQWPSDIRLRSNAAVHLCGLVHDSEGIERSGCESL